jgi:hypothetical protein
LISVDHESFRMVLDPGEVAGVIISKSVHGVRTPDLPAYSCQIVACNGACLRSPMPGKGEFQ